MSTFKFSPYSKCRVKLTCTGAAILNDYLDAKMKETQTYVHDLYYDDSTGDWASDWSLEIDEYKQKCPQRFKRYVKGDYYEDEFDFVMDMLMSHLSFNKNSFSQVFCYLGDGDLDKCWIEIVED